MRKKGFWLLLALGLQACTYYREIPVYFPDGTSFPLRIAESYKKQQRAWLGQKAPFQKGVLFVFLREEEQAYWRQNTRPNVDVVCLDTQHRVTYLESDIPHREKYVVDSEIPFLFCRAKYLLELPAGTARAHQVAVGAALPFTFPEENRPKDLL